MYWLVSFLFVLVLLIVVYVAVIIIPGQYLVEKGLVLRDDQYLLLMSGTTTCALSLLLSFKGPCSNASQLQ